MYEILRSVLHFIRPASTTIIDNVAFQAHYRLTTMCLVICSLLVTLKQFFGDPINCFTAFEKDIPDKVLNNFCWMHSTFTLPGSLAKRLGIEVAAPGVEKHTPTQEKIYHQYYQWVCFFLLFQAVMFYVPHLIWKILEGRKMNKLTSGMENPYVIVDENTKARQHNRIQQLASYFVENIGGHTAYAWMYFLCELFNLVNVIGNIYFVDKFLGNQFTQYGTEVLKFAHSELQENRINPMLKVFPRITKCTFFKFGPSGNLEDRDALCVLPLNIINEKIFIFLWFWFVLLALISSAALVYRFFWLGFRGLRTQMLINFNRKAGRIYLIRLSNKFSIGDWFMVMLVSKNLHSLNFREFIDEMVRIIDDGLENGNGPKSNIPSAPDPYLHKI